MTDPQSEGPQGADPQGADPQGADPQGADPQGADPHINAPQGASPHTADPHTADLHAVVVGGGVAGLVAAREIAKIGVRVTVLEAGDAAGGAVARVRVAGIPVDSGAESFATRGGHVAALVDELGLTGEVVRPNPEGAWLRLPDGAGATLSVPMPRGGVLGIPSNPLADDVRRALGWGGAWRAYLDRIMPVLTIGTSHNLGRLVERRLGRKVLDRLVSPVAGGVYSASPYDLDVDLAAPGLNRALTRAGSLSGGVSLLRGDAKPGAAVAGLRGGMYTLVEALVASIEALGGTVRTDASATAITRADDSSPARWRTTLADTPTDTPASLLDSDFVVIAAPERTARALLSGAAADRLPALDDAMGAVPEGPAPIELVTLVLDAPALDAHPRGTGILVAPGSSVRAKAMTHSSAKWSWLAKRIAEQPDGAAHRHVIRLSYGRQGDADATQQLGDEALVGQALADASELFGVELTRAQLVDAARTPWRGTVPVATIGHREAAERVREAVAEIEGVEVTGAWLSGTGLASVIPDAVAAASRIRHGVVARTSMP